MNDCIENLFSNLSFFRESIISILGRNKLFIENFLKSIIIGIILYMLVGEDVLNKIAPSLGLVVIIVLLILLMTLFCNSEVFILKYIYLLFGLFIALIINKISKVTNFYDRLLLYMANSSMKNYIVKSFEYYVVHLIVLLVIVVPCCFIKNKNDLNSSTNFNNIKPLYPSREDAFKKLEAAIEKCSGIGINGDFGIGKSVLVENYKNKYSKNIYISISSVSMNIDNIEAYILKQLRQVLLKNRIYDNSIDAIIAYFEKWKLANIFIDNMSYCDMFESIKKNLKLIKNIKIIFIIDDLDRVVNKEIIIKIFNIFELLCDENGNNNCVKSIYLYDINNLIDIMYENIVNSGDNRNKLFPMFKRLIHKYIKYEIVALPPQPDDFEMIVSSSQAKYVEVANDDQLKNKVMIIIKEINSYYKGYTNDSEYSFGYYCRMNSRDIDIIINEYRVLCDYIRIGNGNERVYLEALIFKYFFPTDYQLFLNQHSSLPVFLLKLHSTAQNEFLNKIITRNERDYKQHRYWLIYCIFEINRNIHNTNNTNTMQFSIQGNEVIDTVLKKIE